MAKKILVFGDSHSHLYNKLGVLKKAKQYDSLIFGYGVTRQGFPGASLRGIGKTRDSTLNISEKILDTITSEDIVVLVFGQVDIELGFYFRKCVKNIDENADTFIKNCVDSYKVFIERLQEKTENIIIKGVNMPTIMNRQDAVKYTSKIIFENLTEKEDRVAASTKLRQVLPDILTRIEMSKKLNHALELACIELNVDYFDINEQTCHGNGFVREEFMSISPDNHLLASVGMLKIHFDCLKKAVKKLIVSKIN